MNELKLTELAPYLPYGLRMSVDRKVTSILKLWLYQSDFKTCDIGEALSMKYLPILRPLSDLTRVIEHDEEKFAPIDRLEYKYGYLGFNTKTPIIDQAGYHAIQTLLSWHMDLFSLIPRNLAVDYNTVNQNV